MDHLKTGDLVMFSGKYWTSYTVRFLTWSKFSHCGMLLRDPANLPKGLYLLQCDGTDQDFGVQLSLFSEYVEGYDGKVFVYPIQGVEPNSFDRLDEIYQQTQDIPYSLYPPDIVRVLNGGCFHRANTTQYFVCSTYTAYVYKQIGLLCPCNDWTLVQPKHLVEKSDTIMWQNCSFGTPLQLK